MWTHPTYLFLHQIALCKDCRSPDMLHWDSARNALNSSNWACRERLTGNQALSAQSQLCGRPRMQVRADRPFLEAFLITPDSPVADYRVPSTLNPWREKSLEAKPKIKIRKKKLVHWHKHDPFNSLHSIDSSTYLPSPFRGPRQPRNASPWLWRGLG